MKRELPISTTIYALVLAFVLILAPMFAPALAPSSSTGTVTARAFGDWCQALAAPLGHSPWAANYRFGESTPPDFVMEYRLAISEGTAGALKAILDVDGHMTAIRTNCRAVSHGDNCEIRYVADHSDKDSPSLKLTNSFKPNDLLLTLTKSNGKLITTFGAITPLLRMHKRPGVYFAIAQPEKTADKSKPSQIQPEDLRPPLRVLLRPKHQDSIELKDGFIADGNADSIVVHIPGAYGDKLSTAAAPIGRQLAAAIFARVNLTASSTESDALSNDYVGKEDVKRAGSDVTMYLFRARNERIAHIFIYFNELYGLTGVVEMTPPKKGKHP